MTQDEALQRLNITVDLIPSSASNRPGTKISPTHITIHNTSNTAKGANAAMHAQYVKGPDARAREVSWHFTVDDSRTFKHLPTNEKGWHAGNGNRVSIGIEVCEHKGINKAEAIDRAALLTALMMLAYRIPADNVVPHKFWTGKDCPRVILREPGKFQAFRERAADYLAELKAGAGGGVAPANAGLEGEAAGEPYEVFGDDTVSPALAAVIDVAEGPGVAMAGYEAVGADDQIARMERLIGRLTLENDALRRALAELQGTASGVEPETD
jgi:N-acetylmuramoyl-L-alanine amidase